jgi:hypothetical protein
MREKFKKSFIHYFFNSLASNINLLQFIFYIVYFLNIATHSKVNELQKKKEKEAENSRVTIMNS